MSVEQNIATQEKLGESVSSGNFDTFEEIFASNVVDHDPAPDQGPGPQGFRDMFTTMRSAFPDLKVAVDHMVTDDDNVCIAYTITGTHQGDYEGVPATGKAISARAVQIARFENGQIIERWGSSDELGILRELQAG